MQGRDHFLGPHLRVIYACLRVFYACLCVTYACLRVMYARLRVMYASLRVVCDSDLFSILRSYIVLRKPPVTSIFTSGWMVIF